MTTLADLDNAIVDHISEHGTDPFTSPVVRELARQCLPLLPRNRLLFRLLENRFERLKRTGVIEYRRVGMKYVVLKPIQVVEGE